MVRFSSAAIELARIPCPFDKQESRKLGGKKTQKQIA
jgi:hypothetical protein